MDREGVTFLQALEEKYADEDYQLLFAGSLKQDSHAEICASSSGKRKKVIFPPCIVLQNFSINRIAPCQELHQMATCLTEIDLSFNRIADWSEVIPFVRTITSLESLNLSFNPLSCIKPDDLMSICGPAEVLCHHLRRLVLNGTRIDQGTVFSLLEWLPGLEELHLSLNGYSGFPEQLAKENMSARERNKVKTLYIDSNNLEEWDSLLTIGQLFPHLEILFAGHNPLRGLHTADAESLTSAFPYLRRLHASQIELENWDALEMLNFIPQLKDIRILGCNLWKDEAPVGSPKKSSTQSLPPRQQVISRLPKLQVLNGTPVDAIERMDAERAFIRFYHGSDVHPRRYEELVRKHGELKPLAEVELGAPVFVDVLLTCGNIQRRPYKLNVRQTVGQLKKNVSSVTGLSPSKCRMFFVDSEVDIYGPDELKFPGRAVFSYGFKSGDELIVEPK